MLPRLYGSFFQLGIYEYWTDDKHCFYCGILLKPSTDAPQRADTRTRDHVIPRCRNGTITVSCCFSCNQLKGHWDIEQFRLYFAMLTNKKAGDVIFFGERQLG